MPSDPRKRQKKLERRNARRKEKKHSVVRTQSAGLPGQLTAASKLPVLNCYIIEAQGMGSLHFSREFTNGQVAVANFLVDRYCLGIKDTWAEVVHRTDYDEKYVRNRNIDIQPRRLPPEEARKLLEEAVEYARGIGLEPHPSYEKAMLLFGDVDSSQSNAHFEFGKDGKPLFVGGPEDSVEYCRKVVSILMNHCGPDGFKYVFPFGEDEIFEDEDEGDRW